MHFWGFLSAKVICSSCCRFMLLLNIMCSADIPPNEPFKNICKMCAKLHCRGSMKLQNKGARFKTMHGRGSAAAARGTCNPGTRLFLPRNHSETFWILDTKSSKKHPKQQKNPFLMSVIMSHHIMRYYICLWWDATWQDVMQCNVSKNVNNPLLGIRYLLSIPIARVWTEFIEADGSAANAKLSVAFANQHTSQFTASPNYFWVVGLMYDCITMLNKVLVVCSLVTWSFC